MRVVIEMFYLWLLSSARTKKRCFVARNTVWVSFKSCQELVTEHLKFLDRVPVVLSSNKHVYFFPYCSVHCQE